MAIPKATKGHRSGRIQVSKLKDRRLPGAKTGISPFLLQTYLTREQTLSPATRSFIQDQLANNQHARAQFERMRDEQDGPTLDPSLARTVDLPESSGGSFCSITFTSGQARLAWDLLCQF